MKSFSQFLQESYLSEEIPAGMTRAQYNALPSASRRRLGGSNAAYGKKGQTLQGSAADLSIRSARKEINPQGKTTKVKSPTRGGDIVPYSAPPKPTAPASAQSAPPKPAAIVKASPSTPATTPEIKPVSVSDVTPKQKALPAAKPAAATATASSSTIKPPAPAQLQSTNARRASAAERLKRAAAGTGPSGKTIVTPTRQAAKATDTALTAAGSASRLGKFSKFAGPASAVLDTALSTADERAKGSGWARSLAKGATVAAGGLLGGAAGAIGGGGILSAATGTVGALAGGAAAEKAFDTIAGANAKERAAMAKANRQSQAGTTIKGIGGPTSFSQKKPGGPAFMSTGVGKQRKTVQLAKTGVVNRGGQSVAGHLAFKGGKAVYKAGPSAQSLAKTSSNPLERIGRTFFAGAYKQHDAAKAQQALQRAIRSDVERNKKLGVKYKPGG